MLRKFLLNILLIAILGGLCLQLSSASSQIIKSTNFIEKIEKGENISNAIIVGELNFSKGNIQRIITFPINIKNSRIQDNVIFDHFIFENVVDFSGTTFEKKVSFRGANFNKNVYFVDSCFENKANFEESRFQSSAYFWNSLFGENSNFRNAIFFGDITSFRSAHFRGITTFENTLFEGLAIFSEARFDEDTDFINSCFMMDVDFSKSAFLRYANFEMAKFKSDTTLWGARFSSELRLTGAKFDQFKAEWDSIRNNLAYDKIIYLALIKNYKELGRFEDADNCYYQYRYKNQIEKVGLAKVLDWISWQSCGYGVRPLYTIRFSLFLIFLFGLIFCCGDGIEKSDMNSNKAPSKTAYAYNNKIFKNSLIAYLPDYILRLYSLPQSFYFSLLIFTFQSRDNWRAIGYYKYMTVLEGIFGILLMGLFLVTLSNIMIRY